MPSIILRLFRNLLFFEGLDYMLGRRIVNFKLGCCILDSQALFVDKINQLIAFVLFDRNVASFGLKDHGCGLVLGFALH